jgi:hypothetical protein
MMLGLMKAQEFADGSRKFEGPVCSSREKSR